MVCLTREDTRAHSQTLTEPEVEMVDIVRTFLLLTLYSTYHLLLMQQSMA